MSGNRSVVLFRSRNEPDPYEEKLHEAGFACSSIPVLRFEFVHEEELRQALEHPRNYGGLIVTSPRAVEAMAQAMTWLPTENVSWHARPVFAVGPSTASELRQIGFEPIGEESGSGAALAQTILHHQFEKPLLYLIGSRRRDELPTSLRENNIDFIELCVYRSIERANLELSSQSVPDWVVFFSPSGVEAVQRDGGWDLRDIRVAAIGRTTADALRSTGVEVHAMASEPTPEAVAQAVATSDSALPSSA